MQRFVSCAAFIAAVFSVAPIAAAQVSTNPPAAQTESVQVSKAIAMRNALTALTGLHDVIVGSSNNKSVARVMYDIDAKARNYLNDSIAALNAVLEPTQKTINELNQKASADNGGTPLPDSDLSPKQKTIQNKLNDDVQAIMDGAKPVALLVHISRGDIKEPVPGEIVTPLMCPKEQPTPPVACVIVTEARREAKEMAYTHPRVPAIVPLDKRTMIILGVFAASIAGAVTVSLGRASRLW
jgi:hypothetical protein